MSENVNETAGNAEADLPTIPGTRLVVDWPKLVSGQDIIFTAPPQKPLDGLLLGNGDIGVSLYGPPECLTLQVGKNDLWDYRAPMDDKRPVTHREFLAKYANSDKPPLTTYLKPDGDDPWNADILQTHHAPMPTIKPAAKIRFRNESLAGAAYVSRTRMWDAEVTTDLAQPRGVAIRTFVSYWRNLIVVDYTPDGEQRFDIELARHQDSTGAIPNGPEFGAAGRDMWVRYRFPADPANYPAGFEYVMYGRVIGGDDVGTEVDAAASMTTQWVTRQGTTETVEGQVVAHVRASQSVRLLMAVVTTRDDADPFVRARRDVYAAEQEALVGSDGLAAEHRRWWHDFWRRSFVQLPEKPFLTQQWFVSQYHLACCWRRGRLAPGLFGPWCWEDFPGWGNDYHWDYNMQQAVWGAYSSNHLEQTIPYDEAVLALLPAAKTDAREVYGLDGAKFFLTTYPRRYAHNPFPLLHYDKMMSLNGWVVHPLWWHYLYSQDEDYLQTTAYPPLRDCADFYAGYLTRAADGRYDIWPTAVWDIPFSPHLENNKNCHMDLAFVRYVLRASIAASEVLGVDEARRRTWWDIVERLREYPTTGTPEGQVFVNFEGLGVTKFGLPIATTAVFPGDDIGLHSSEPERSTAWRTARALPYTNEGDIVLTGMAKIRLGSDELESIEQHTREVLLSNRGMWVSNWQHVSWVHAFGWPLLINETILQSYTGRLHVAPVKTQVGISFGQLRTVGAFLVSGEIKPGGQVSYVVVTSETGRPCAMVRPWEGRIRVRELSSMSPVPFSEDADVLTFPTEIGATYVVDRPDDSWEQQPMRMLP